MRSNEQGNANANDSFRDAFNRLKSGRPTVVERGTPVSQNNVAREAGRDPSALRKSRYPELIKEIQEYVAAVSTEHPYGDSGVRDRRSRKVFEEKIERLRVERDHAMSLLLEADSKILQLTAELEVCKTTEFQQN